MINELQFYFQWENVDNIEEKMSDVNRENKI